MAQLGNATLYLILVLATWAGALAVIGGRRGSRRLLATSTLLVHALAAMSSLAMLVLVYGLVIHDFSISYIHSHSSRSLPLFYRVTGVWAGMEGSLLTWVWALTIVSSLAVRQNRRRLHDMMPQLIAVLMSVVVFFGVLLTLHSNPFLEFLTETPLTGRGMNPLLQNPYMVTHPPALYLGFVGLTIPFAMGMAALLSGRVDDTWLRAARPWALWAWYFLSLGLVLGMLWAYEELGWGGYWGWDPVENAAFMPWLLATAFLHSLIVQERRQMLKAWTITAALLAFVMTIFGTFMTRSGFIESVHAFARSNIGYVFLAYIVLLLLGGFGVILWRRDLLRGNPFVSLASRELAVILSNWVLLIGALLVMALTILPTVSQLLMGEKINVAVPVFKSWMQPVGLLLLALTGIGPLLGWRKTTRSSSVRQLRWPLAIGLLVVVTTSVIGRELGAPMVAWGLAAVVVAGILQELLRAALSRVKAGQAGFLGALLDQVWDNRRRYGGYVVHIGTAMMFVGFAGDAFKIKKDVLLQVGQKTAVGRYALRYDGIRISHDPLKRMETAHLTVYRAGKPIGGMRPARWFYSGRPSEPTSEVSIIRSMREDLFVALGRYADGGRYASFMVVINPLVNWIWIGFLLMTLGTSIGGWPMLWRRGRLVGCRVGRSMTQLGLPLLFGLLAGGVEALFGSGSLVSIAVAGLAGLSLVYGLVFLCRAIMRLVGHGKNVAGSRALLLALLDEDRAVVAQTVESLRVDSRLHGELDANETPQASALLGPLQERLAALDAEIEALKKAGDGVRGEILVEVWRRVFAHEPERRGAG